MLPVNATKVTIGMLSLSTRADREAPDAAGGEPMVSPSVSSSKFELQLPGMAPRPEFPRQIENEIPFLRRAVRRWHREKPNADDLVQDTLVQALANAHLWQPGTNLRAWLTTIMRNEFLAAIARSNRSITVLQAIAAADPGEGTDTREVRLILRDLSAALRRLPGNQRSAVLLIGVEGKSYNEAAQTMGTSVGAVRSHLMRGRDGLKTAMRGSDARAPFAPRPAGMPAAIAPRGMRVAPAAAAGAD
jgi:RNA polymerase sigma-70 factor, ECF subfamily